MRVYISGDLKGAPDIVEQKFSDAEACLRDAGHEPINPFKLSDSGLPKWPDRLEILSLASDAIFLLSDWLQSNEAMTEKYLCSVTGKKIIFQSQLDTKASETKDYEAIVEKIAGAIEEVTGLKLSDYSSGPRIREEFFARMIFAYQCKKGGLSDEEIRRYIDRDRTTILHYFKQYEIDFAVTAKFRSTASRVDEKLYPKVY